MSQPLPDPLVPGLAETTRADHDVDALIDAPMNVVR
jgi:hypothetical protein